MNTNNFKRSASAAVIGAAVLLHACGLEKVDEAPSLSGPSALANAMRLTANPDFVVADNESVSVIQATLRNQNGQPLGGRAVVFRITDENGAPVGLGELTPVGGITIAAGSAATAVTNGNGVAEVRLSAPARTDLLSSTSVTVQARQVTDDFNGAVLSSVRVQIIPAEPVLFPPNPNNTAPNCGFALQPFRAGDIYAAGEQILFQSTASDPDQGGRIVRFEWHFGDGVVDDKPNVNHAYGAVGVYTVSHQVTDNNGAQSSCFATVTVK